jgi:N-acetylglucosaminyldiphosphoundecaprenol N-acetyl-beta-D-mannosaminyltransferase
MTVQRIEFLGIPLDTGVTVADVCELLRRRDGLRLITFVNPAAWALARKYPHYVGLLRLMSLVLPDGEGVARACRMLTKLQCPRLSFDTTSVAGPFFATAAAEKISVMLIGGQPGVDEDTHRKLQQAWPNLHIAGTMHGFDDFAPKVARIIATAPDAVVVGMGSPRQEEFLIALRDAGYRGLAITCGGFFDQYLESDQYYPEWIDRWNLRFAWRLYKEPRRLWRRYLIDYQIFIWKVVREAAYGCMPVLRRNK